MEEKFASTTETQNYGGNTYKRIIGHLQCSTCEELRGRPARLYRDFGFPVTILQPSYYQAISTGTDWWHYNDVATYAQLLSHKMHHLNIPLVSTFLQKTTEEAFSPSQAIIGIPSEVKKVVCLAKSSNHFAVFVAHVQEKKVFVYDDFYGKEDGQAERLHVWQEQITQLLKKMNAHGEEEDWARVIGESISQQTDFHSCGPRACLRICSEYSYIGEEEIRRMWKAPMNEMRSSIVEQLQTLIEEIGPALVYRQRTIRQHTVTPPKNPKTDVERVKAKGTKEDTSNLASESVNDDKSDSSNSASLEISPQLSNDGDVLDFDESLKSSSNDTDDLRDIGGPAFGMASPKKNVTPKTAGSDETSNVNRGQKGEEVVAPKGTETTLGNVETVVGDGQSNKKVTNNVSDIRITRSRSDGGGNGQTQGLTEEEKNRMRDDAVAHRAKRMRMEGIVPVGKPCSCKKGCLLNRCGCARRQVQCSDACGCAGKGWQA